MREIVSKKPLTVDDIPRIQSYNFLVLKSGEKVFGIVRWCPGIRKYIIHHNMLGYRVYEGSINSLAKEDNLYITKSFRTFYKVHSTEDKIGFNEIDWHKHIYVEYQGKKGFVIRRRQCMEIYFSTMDSQFFNADADAFKFLTDTGYKFFQE